MFFTPPPPFGCNRTFSLIDLCCRSTIVYTDNKWIYIRSINGSQKKGLFSATIERVMTDIMKIRYNKSSLYKNEGQQILSIYVVKGLGCPYLRLYILLLSRFISPHQLLFPKDFSELSKYFFFFLNTSIFRTILCLSAVCSLVDDSCTLFWRA